MTSKVLLRCCNLTDLIDTKLLEMDNHHFVQGVHLTDSCFLVSFELPLQGVTHLYYRTACLSMAFEKRSLQLFAHKVNCCTDHLFH